MKTLLLVTIALLIGLSAQSQVSLKGIYLGKPADEHTVHETSVANVTGIIYSSVAESNLVYNLCFIPSYDDETEMLLTLNEVIKFVEDVEWHYGITFVENFPDDLSMTYYIQVDNVEYSIITQINGLEGESIYSLVLNIANVAIRAEQIDLMRRDF